MAATEGVEAGDGAPAATTTTSAAALDDLMLAAERDAVAGALPHERPLNARALARSLCAYARDLRARDGAVCRHRGWRTGCEMKCTHRVAACGDARMHAMRGSTSGAR